MQFRNTARKYSFFLKLTAMLALAVSIPLLVGGLTMVRSAGQNLNLQIQQQEERNAESFRMYFLEQYAALKEIAVNIAQNEIITYRRVSSHVQKIVLAQQELRKYLKAQIFAEEIYVNFSKFDYIISSKSSCQKKYFSLYSGVNDEEAAQRLLEGTDAVILYSTFGKEVLNKAALYISVPVGEGLNRENVIWKLNWKALNMSFLGELYADEYELCILDESGNVLLANSEKLFSMLQSINRQEEITRESIMSALQTEAYYPSIKWENGDGFVFVMLRKESQVNESLQAIYAVFTHVLTAMLVTVLITILGVVYFNYRSLLQLVRRIRNEFLSETPQGGELAVISSALDRQAKESLNREMLEETIRQQSQWQETMSWTRLAEGKQIEEKELQQLQKTGGGWFVMILTGVSGEQIFFRAREMGIRLWPVQTEMTYRHAAVAAISLPLEETKKKTVDTIEKLLETETRLGVGTTVTEPEEIRASLWDALSALEWEGEGQVTYFEEVSAAFASMDQYPSAHVLRFLQMVRNGDAMGAMEEIRQTVRSILRNEPDFAHAQYICYDVVSNFLRTVETMGIPATEEEIDGLLNFGNLSGLSGALEKPVYRVCSAVLKRQEITEKERFEAVMRSIEEQFTDPDLNQASLADQHQISVYTLSRMFKQYYGVGYREYITAKRLTLAKELLEKDGSSVSEVALSVGYRDVSYFIRLFKKAYGVTPKQI